jgi:uncharacterized protein
MRNGRAGSAAQDGDWPAMSDKIEITHIGDENSGAYRAELPDRKGHAELTWRSRGSDRVADHTYTPPELRGRGIAGQLVQAMVADAREQGFRIVPRCPYVADWFDRHPEETDLRAE